MSMLVTAAISFLNLVIFIWAKNLDRDVLLVVHLGLQPSLSSNKTIRSSLFQKQATGTLDFGYASLTEK
jgi:hypothetical protein